MSLAKKISAYVNKHKSFSLQELYTTFGQHYKRHTIRARVYESDLQLIRTSKGCYVLAGAELEAVIEQADSRTHIFHIANSAIFFDLVFLDPPYRTRGQRSGKNGNRNMATYDLISADEFGEILLGVEQVLRSESSQIYFMIASGRSSATQVNQYVEMFGRTGLKLNAEGFYQKLNADGSPCNMAQYPMPLELLRAYSFDGKIRDCAQDGSFTMEFRLPRPKLARFGGYPTQKPDALLRQIVKQGTFVGERILDPFAGSGSMINAALSLGRKVHGVELSANAIARHIVRRVESFARGSRLHYQPALMFDDKVRDEVYG